MSISATTSLCSSADDEKFTSFGSLYCIVTSQCDCFVINSRLRYNTVNSTAFFLCG